MNIPCIMYPANLHTFPITGGKHKKRRERFYGIIPKEYE